MRSKIPAFGSAAQRAISLLDKHGPVPASELGARLWPNRTTRGVAVHGGGDYAAQMLLGRLRKRGFVRVEPGEGSSVWALTDYGHATALFLIGRV